MNQPLPSAFTHTHKNPTHSPVLRRTKPPYFLFSLVVAFCVGCIYISFLAGSGRSLWGEICRQARRKIRFYENGGSVPTSLLNKREKVCCGLKSVKYLIKLTLGSFFVSIASKVDA